MNNDKLSISQEIASIKYESSGYTKEEITRIINEIMNSEKK